LRIPATTDEYQGVASPFEHLAQVAYDAYRAALSDVPPLWDDLEDKEQKAWLAAVSAVAGQTGDTFSEPSSGKSLVIKIGDQRHTFGSDFTVGREGGLVIDDDFTSGQHAHFQTVRGLWYIVDLSSTNGTELNGRRVLSAQLLRKRDKIRIGHTVMTVISV
jgi:pSer/pThr/pTyr-binding forkhead associated (FHA) protein